MPLYLLCGGYEHSDTTMLLRKSAPFLLSEEPSDRTRFSCTHRYPVPIRSRVAPPHGVTLLKGKEGDADVRSFQDNITRPRRRRAWGR